MRENHVESLAGTDDVCHYMSLVSDPNSSLSLSLWVILAMGLLPDVEIWPIK